MPRSPASSWLRAILSDVLTATLAATATAGCGGATDGPSSSGAATTSLCRGTVSLFPKGITPAQSVDYLEWRTEQAFLSADAVGRDGFSSTRTVLSGAACVGATDKVACRATLNGLRTLPLDEAACESKFSGYFLQGCEVSYLVFTRGDEVGTATTLDETRAFLGPIDTPEEALWVLDTQDSVNRVCGEEGVPDSTIRKSGDGYEIVYLRNCDQTPSVYTATVGSDGTVTETRREALPAGVSAGCLVAGRRPEGFEPAAPIAAGAMGAYFATMAELEAVSVVAFRRLQRELAALDAPPELLLRVRSAARDEIRHARVTRAIARRHGASISRPSVAPPAAQRTAFDIALDNAREGCVRETFGALVASHQALCAEEPSTREAMRTIAEEETEHAALSWDLAHWLDGQLSPEERGAVCAARHDAVSDLAREIARPVDPLLATAAGLPSAEVAIALLDEASRRLLAA